MVVRLVVMLVDAGATAATMAAEFVVCSDENRVSALGADTMVRLMLFLGTLGAEQAGCNTGLQTLFFLKGSLSFGDVSCPCEASSSS